jgi:hypothetical protein
LSLSESCLNGAGRADVDFAVARHAGQATRRQRFRKNTLKNMTKQTQFSSMISMVDQKSEANSRPRFGTSSAYPYPSPVRSAGARNGAGAPRHGVQPVIVANFSGL